MINEKQTFCGLPDKQYWRSMAERRAGFAHVSERVSHIGKEDKEDE